MKILKTEEFITKYHSKFPNSSIKITGEYIGNKNPIACECSVCEHQWNSTPDSLLKGRGCSKCARNKKKLQIRFLLNITPNFLILLLK